MNLLLINICAILALSTIVSTQKQLFIEGEVFTRNIRKKTMEKKEYRYLKTIDHHLFGNAVIIKIETSGMQLYEGAVKNLPHLRTLRMKECNIDLLAPGAFKNLPKLEVVHLQDNDLTEITNGVFNFLSIRELWLQRNEIRTVRSGAFDNMPNLEEIRLNANRLTRWDSRWFANTPRLTHIYFKRNRITSLPSRAFVNIRPSHKINGTELVDTRILLNRNLISHIDPHAFDELDSLHELNLQNNTIKKIDNRVFSQMSQLHKLNLRRNRISEIDEDAFQNLSEMFELDLSRNKLICVPDKIIFQVKFINVTGNLDLDCLCLYNAREKLSMRRLKNEIVKNDENCNVKVVT